MPGAAETLINDVIPWTMVSITLTLKNLISLVVHGRKRSLLAMYVQWEGRERNTDAGENFIFPVPRERKMYIILNSGIMKQNIRN